MILTTTPIGTPIALPEGFAEDRAYFGIDEVEDAVRYYSDEGYVVLRRLVDASLCDRITTAFDSHVRWSRRPILRQHNMRYETNAFDTDGFLVNPVFNVHDLETRHFRGFRTTSLDLLTRPAVARITARLLGTDRSKLVQSMFFEGSVATWAHQDTYYQDGPEIGSCVAGWFSLEDMAAGTGRFYVCPGSHRLPVLRNEGALNFAFGHERYKRHVLSLAERHGVEWRSPYLAKGDVLFWNSRTIHGSLPARERGLSRASLTAHYLREGNDMLQFHTRIRRQNYTVHNGMVVGHLHNQDEWRNRMVRHLASNFPRTFDAARRLGIRVVLSGRRWAGRDMPPRRPAADETQTPSSAPAHFVETP